MAALNSKSTRLRKTLNKYSNLTQKDIDWECKIRLSYQAMKSYKSLNDKEVAQAVANLLNQFNETLKLAKFESIDIINSGIKALDMLYADITKNIKLKSVFLDAVKTAIEECMFVERINHTRSPRKITETN